MRFMVMVKATKDSEAGVLPDEKLLADMGKYNEELVKAGVMLAGEGLQASSKGARVRFSGSKRTVIDGPFPETKELIAGYWLFQVKSLEEAIEWVKRCPNPMPNQESEIEIRQVFEADDWSNGSNWKSREGARADLFDYIEMWYNRERRHSTLGYLSPEDYEEKRFTREVTSAA
jgi:hypothetical protein